MTTPPVIWGDPRYDLFLVDYANGAFELPDGAAAALNERYGLNRSLDECAQRYETLKTISDDPAEELRAARIAYLEDFIAVYYKRCVRALQHTMRTTKMILTHGPDSVSPMDARIIANENPASSMSLDILRPDGTLVSLRRHRPAALQALATEASLETPILLAAKRRRVGGDLGSGNLSSKAGLLGAVKQLLDFDSRNGGWFEFPVSDAAAPGYSTRIKNPMDLTTLANLIKTGAVTSQDALIEKIALIVSNAKTYNAPGVAAHSAAIALESFAATLFQPPPLG